MGLEQQRMQKKTVAIVVLIAVLAGPALIYAWTNYIRGFLPPKETSLKTPYQFEAAFNEQMAQYGMSLDLDSVNYGYGDGYASKTVPVNCTDGSDISCRILMTSDKLRAAIILIDFEQPFDGTIPESYQQLFEMLIRVFETPLYEDPDLSYHRSMSYHEALNAMQSFCASSESEQVIHLSASLEDTDSLVLERRDNGEEKQPSLLLQLRILTVSRD